MATIKEIAKIAGVSRGTVDRVLNKRGSVSPETKKRVLEVANALKYVPNTLGKKLAVTKRNLKFGCILFDSTASNLFFEDVILGINDMAEELSEYGATVELKHSAIDDADMQVKLMDELVEMGVDGVVITPINDIKVANKIRVLSDNGIPVVTTNSDIENSGRIAYVGSDYYKSGTTAGGLMDLVSRGKANIGVLIGSPLVLCHSERVNGFKDYLAENKSSMKIVATAKNNDDDFESYAQTMKLLKDYPEIDALFLASAGIKGACRATIDSARENVRIINYDLTEVSYKLLKDKIISAVITQDPFTQGRKPLEILLNKVGMGIDPEEELFYTDIGIKIKENL